MKKLLSVAACAAIIAMAGSAGAYSFDMGANSTVTGSAFSDPGLVIQVSVYPLDGIAFNLLNPGDSYSFNFARFWTTETDVGADDIVPQALTASVDFDLPPLAQDVNGDSVGFFSLFLGFIKYNQGWQIEWNSPVSVPFGYLNTGLFDLSLSDASFATFLAGPDGTFCTGVDVIATITLVSEPVPEPGTILLMGAGLAGLAGYSRKRGKKS